MDRIRIGWNRIYCRMLPSLIVYTDRCTVLYCNIPISIPSILSIPSIMSISAVSILFYFIQSPCSLFFPFSLFSLFSKCSILPMLSLSLSHSHYNSLAIPGQPSPNSTQLPQLPPRPSIQSIPLPLPHTPHNTHPPPLPPDPRPEPSLSARDSQTE